MPRFTAERTVSATADDAYGVAADVARYKDFLPLLKRSHVRNVRAGTNGETLFDAELAVAYDKMNLREAFISRVTCNPATRTVTAVSSDGPFKALTAVWTITPAGAGARVAIAIDYEVHSLLLQLALRATMDMAVQRVMAAFEQRTAALSKPLVS